MPEATMIILDNFYNQQNQDYLPNRYLIQKDSIKSIIIEKLQESPENEIGIVPLCQSTYDILTPTKDRHALETYLSQKNLHQKTFPSRVVEWCSKALNFRTHSSKSILFFLGSEIENCDEMEKIILLINEMLEDGILIRMVFYAEAIMYSELFEERIVGDNFTYVIVSTDDDFYKTVMMLMGKTGDLMEDDPDLALAIELSRQEQ
ncbi:26S proteasome non-ATPase regulatory subunit 4 [Gurleya vavrai]